MPKVYLDEQGNPITPAKVYLDESGEPITTPSSQTGPLISGGNLFTKTLDALNTPQQMIYGAAMGLMKGKPIGQSAMEGARNDLSGREVLEAAGMPRGRTLDEMLPSAGGNIPFFGDTGATGAAGLAMDVVTDPINAIGGLGLGRKVMGLGAKAVEMSPLARFLPSQSEQAVKALIRAEKLKEVRRVEMAKQAGEKVAANVADISKRTGLSVDEVNRRISGRVEQKTGEQLGLPETGYISGNRGQITQEGLPRLPSDQLEGLRQSFETTAAEHGRMFPRKVLPTEIRPASPGEVQETIDRLARARGFRVKDETSMLRDTTRVLDQALRKDGVRSFNAAENLAEDVVAIQQSLGFGKQPVRETAEGAVTSVVKGEPEIPAIVQQAAQVKATMRDTLIRERAHGLGTVELDDTSVDYLTHLMTDEAKQALIGSSAELKKFGSRYNARHGFQIARQWRGMPIEQLQQAGRAAKLPGYPGVRIGKLFEDNPALLQTVRAIAGEKAITDADIFTRSAFELGKRLDDPAMAKIVAANPGKFTKLSIASSPDPRVEQLSGFLKNYVFESDVAKHLDSYYESVTNPKFSNAFWQGYDRVQDEWKRLTLVYFPAYHARNAVGNMFNSMLGGVYNPAEYARAAGFQRGAAEKVYEIGDMARPKGEWDKLLSDYGITGQFKQYMGLQERLTPGRKASLLRAPERAGMQAGKAIEDNARIAHFFNKLDNGMSPTEAALSVKKYLFDYGDMTDFEKVWMRRALPFYAWTRFNLPLQMRSVVEQPHKFQALGDIINAMERDRPKADDEDKLIAEWMKENTQVKVGTDRDGNPEYFLLGGWLPSADIGKLDKPVKLITDGLSPFIKAPIEMITNKSLFFGRDIESFPGEKERFLGTPMRKQTSNILRNLRVLTEADRYLAMYQKRAGLEEPLTDRQGEDLSPTIIRSLFGTKVYSVNLPEQRRRRAFEVRELVGKRNREVRRDKPFNVDTINELIEAKR